ncbi:MAG: LacI family DNA-binding transcriptional regulator [Bacteroidota bacterium]|nr:LacI family DNA-binding transcriptional regulator [Bacteroidota bacterium]
MSVDIKTLAKNLNLSISTISRALRDSYEISDKTKLRVKEMAAKLNYQPNPYASSLRKHKSKTIAVVIPEITNNFFALAINGIEYVAQEKEYHVLIYLTHENIKKEIGFASHLQNGRIDGMLMSISAETNNYDHLIELKKKEVPLVFFDRICEAIESSSITTDDFEGGFNATEHLIQRGCKKIAYLDLSRYLSNSNKRMQGYIAALVKHNISIDERLIMRFTNNIAANEEQIVRVLSGAEKPDGVFASVEKLAIATYNVCQRLNINIPKQLKIISFSNLEISSLLNPSLTTITQPAFEIGKQAALQLFRYLEKKNMMNVHEKIILKSTLIPRGSTAI